VEELLKPRAVLSALLVVAACARSAPPPTPDVAQTRPPDLSGERVMVLPAQPGPRATGVGEPVPGLDGEIAFWLAESAPRVDWVFPPAIERALARSPSLDIRLDALAVSSFHRAEVRNIGDPLFGDLRALNALVGARYALLPVAAAFVQDTASGGRVEMNVALIDTQGGRVLWFGAVAGEDGRAGSPETAATAARALARVIAR
jgi:hypothetical protein